MGGRTSHKEPPDSRWLAVEARDVFGRIYYRWVPVIGARFGSRTVQGHSEGRATVRCECGRVDTLDARCLRRGGHRCRSCSAIEVSETKSDAHTITDPKLRALWAHRRSGAISRCYDPRHKAYPNYGARGIKVFQEWLDSPEAWFKYAITLDDWWMHGMDLDRIDNDKGYEPGNLRIVSRSENTRNRRSTAWIEIKGERISIPEFRERFCKGWRSCNSITHHLSKGRSGDEIAAIYRRTHGGI